MAYATTPKVGGERLYEQVGMGGYKIAHVRERVTGTGFCPSLTLSQKQPAKSKLIWAAIKAAGAVAVYAGSSAAATAGTMGVALVSTAPTSLATGATTANYALIPSAAAIGTTGYGSITDNTVGRGTAPSAATAGGVLLDRSFENPASTERTLYLVPFMQTTAAEAAQRFQVATGTAATVATTGLLFGTSTSSSSSFDVDLYFEEYEDPAD
jgi:hypothetical protein